VAVHQSGLDVHTLVVGIPFAVGDAGIAGIALAKGCTRLLVDSPVPLMDGIAVPANRNALPVVLAAGIAAAVVMKEEVTEKTESSRPLECVVTLKVGVEVVTFAQQG